MPAEIVSLVVDLLRLPDVLNLRSVSRSMSRKVDVGRVLRGYYWTAFFYRDGCRLQGRGTFDSFDAHVETNGTVTSFWYESHAPPSVYLSIRKGVAQFYRKDDRGSDLSYELKRKAGGFVVFIESSGRESGDVDTYSLSSHGTVTVSDGDVERRYRTKGLPERSIATVPVLKNFDPKKFCADGKLKNQSTATLDREQTDFLCGMLGIETVDVLMYDVCGETPIETFAVNRLDGSENNYV